MTFDKVVGAHLQKLRIQFIGTKDNFQIFNKISIEIFPC